MDNRLYIIQLSLNTNIVSCHSFFHSYSYLFCVYVYAHTWLSEDNKQEFILFFHHMGSRIQLGLSSLSSPAEPPYQLPSPVANIFNDTSILIA